MSEFEKLPIDCRSRFGLRAIARMFSGKNFFKNCIKVGYGGRRQFLSAFGLNCTTLWLFSDPHRTAVSQNYVCRAKVSTLFLMNFGMQW